ncbi:NAD(P)H-binding protein [Nonomuraea gerenzanensis]|uniref:Putative nucleoside-diphosphate-sugar epimerase n=1 Tax=Nonomuraea gerenzanensis TaxID=93944 RepID=A0A1M4EAP7_9ACTN|nr:NAD(P)H-binding protein [Nonomuraea gerenzanensis]UBU18083.1 NAD(P)H-binding protein [Nonomuraea gerenzanensis]SBO95890.1 putative nucleoside-diphosphate-sugar epimerase [Nonomuraea gerenzanensis]
MYAITGVTGHVGGAAARRLLARAEPVRAVVRDPARGKGWIEAGAETFVADLGDRAALAEAFGGCRAAFVMLPTDPAADDAGHRALADSIAGAVLDSGVPYVVMLSSLGAELPEGTGPIRWLHHLEHRLRETGVLLTAVRSGHFQEKVEAALDAARGAGVYPVFGDSADTPAPMIATHDVGKVAADALLTPPARSEVIDLDSPSYTERQVAEELGAVLGRPLQVITIPQAQWIPSMVEAGVPPQLARELAGMYEAVERGLLQPAGDRRIACPTEIGETLRRLV